MLARNRAALALFGSAMLGADNCTINLPWDSGGDTSAPIPVPADFCHTDPPVGCWGLCLFPDMTDTDISPPPATPTATSNCTDPGTGDLATQFVMDINTILVCDPTLYGGSYVVFPTDFFLARTVAKVGSCVIPPLPPLTESLAQLMGGGQ